MRHRLVAILAVAGFLLARGLRAEDKPRGPTEKVRAFLGGERVVGILSGATRVECFRVFPEKPNEPMGKECGGYPVISTAKDQTRDFAADIAAVLLDEKTYDFEKAKKAVYQPAVGFRLWRDKDWADVTVSFASDEIEISSKLPTDREITTAHEDCDTARAALIKLAKIAFPEDKEVQDLAEKGK